MGEEREKQILGSAIVDTPSTEKKKSLKIDGWLEFQYEVYENKHTILIHNKH